MGADESDVADEATGKDRDYIQSIERGFAVLLAFDEELPRPTLAELAARTSLSRPAVRRILLTLQKLGYVEGLDGRWSLTPRVLTIGQHYAATHGLIEAAQPHLLRLAEATQESASLSTLDGSDVVYVARVQVRRILSMNVDVGARVPPYATSMGRVLLAWEEESRITEVLGSRPLVAITPHTLIDPVQIRDALHVVRTQGYAIVESELELGLISASVPVRDPHSRVVAALAYSTSSGRMTAAEVESTVVPLMLDAAAAIGVELSGQTRRGLGRQQRDGFF